MDLAVSVLVGLLVALAIAFLALRRFRPGPIAFPSLPAPSAHPVFRRLGGSARAGGRVVIGAFRHADGRFAGRARRGETCRVCGMRFDDARHTDH